jgi:predicted aldo/keto reductase-like oxidoreductase
LVGGFLLLVDKPISKRPLGSTGEMVSLLGVGGFHIGKYSDPKVGIQIIRTAIDNGVNFLDNAWCYHSGRSEEVMGKALEDGYRKKVFISTRNHGRDYATYRKQLSDSLQRLQTDYIDLVQFHEINREGLPDKIFKDGAIDAAVEAKEQGKIRYIGFSGHKWPKLFLEMLNKDFKWDTVQLPHNVMDYHYRSFIKQVIPKLVKKKIGIIGMKSLGGGPGGNFLKTGTLRSEECIRYAMSQPVSTLVSGMDSMEVLERNLKIASEFTPMSEEEKTVLLGKSKIFSENARYEWYKQYNSKSKKG